MWLSFNYLFLNVCVCVCVCVCKSFKTLVCFRCCHSLDLASQRWEFMLTFWLDWYILQIYFWNILYFYTYFEFEYISLKGLLCLQYVYLISIDCVLFFLLGIPASIANFLSLEILNLFNNAIEVRQQLLSNQLPAVWLKMFKYECFLF